MIWRIDLGFVALLIVFAIMIAVRYLLTRKARRRFWKRYYEVQQEQDTFLRTFHGTPFDNFSAFNFRLGRFSHVSPFPELIEGEWRYGISLSRSDAEDIVTITHEVSECTIGRVIERLLNLKRPLYLQRKKADKFWVHGKKQKYIVEHVMVTLGEVDGLTVKKLKQRLNKEDIKVWLNRGVE